MRSNGRIGVTAMLALLALPWSVSGGEPPRARVVAIEAAGPEALELAAGVGNALQGIGLEVRTSVAPLQEKSAIARAAVLPDADLRLLVLPGGDALRTYYRPGGPSEEAARRVAAGLHAAVLSALRGAAGDWPDGGVEPCQECFSGAPAGIAVAIDPGPAGRPESLGARLALGLGVADGLRLLGFGEDQTLASKGEMVLPVPGSTLPGANVIFTWNPGSDAQYYFLMIGNWLGGNTLFSANMGTQTTVQVYGLPVDGRDIYVRLWSFIGGAWQSSDYGFKAAGGSLPARAEMLTPTPGATLPTGTVNFQWSAGSAVQRYHLFIGEWPGGNTLYSADQGSSLAANVAGLPQDGRPIYLRLWSLLDGVWQFNDYTYKAAGYFSPVPAQIVSPAPGSKLGSTSLTFTWNAGAGVTRYALHIGTWQGGNNLYNGDLGGSLGAAVTGLPSDGSTIYVRLWSYINGAWQSNDYIYTAMGTPVPFAAAEITAPAPGSTFAGVSATFYWSAGQGVKRYFLMAGSWAGGNNIYGADQATATSATVGGLPTDGSDIFVRLWSYDGTNWVSKDYKYKAASFKP
jgi:hypothetical protein